MSMQNSQGNMVLSIQKRSLDIQKQITKKKKASLVLVIRLREKKRT